MNLIIVTVNTSTASERENYQSSLSSRDTFINKSSTLVKLGEGDIK
jgi:hypothetical protein